MRKASWNAAAILIALAFAAWSAPAPEGGLSPGVVEQIDREVTGQMSRADIPGLSIAVVTDLKVRWASGYGMADLENYVPATASTNYRLASISKTLIATAVLQLVERGQFDLDAPIQRYVPSFPVKQWPVTPRQLLGHTGGIRTYRPGEKDSTKAYASLTDALSIFKDDSLEYQPGTKYLYSTQGYTMLAVAVEGASGRNYFDYVRAHIFEPASMDHARPDSVSAIIPHRTQGYQKLPNGGLVNSGLADTSNKAVICGTVGDLAKFAIALLSGKLIRPETLTEMFAVYPVTQRRTTAGLLGYCMGWNVMSREGAKDLEVFKAGNQQRVTGLLYMRPERKCVVAILCNLEDAPLTVVFARKISDIALGETKGESSKPARILKGTP